MASFGYSTVVAVAAQSVTTHGVNWESVTIIVVPIVACLVGIATFLDTRTNRRETRREKFAEDMQTQMKEEITSAVTNLQTVLLEKLETKEAVNQIRVDLARMSQRIDDINERSKNHPSTSP